ncbi:MAG: right-handed parallel beta-helix repeat-containing protein [Bacteroidota bacterium]|nr:right-handed parallel beta-helix repeat-containing protein [Bacteroidota bacterium]
MTLIICTVIIPFFGYSQSIDTIKVCDYGIKPNMFEDVAINVVKAINACKNKKNPMLVFEKGRYDFYPAHAEVRNYFISNSSSEEECPSKLKTIGLLFEGIKNLKIEGNGSLFMFHGKMTTFAFDHCENIRLQNVKVDFDRPTMSEMIFREVSDSAILADINPDSKYAIIDGKLYWYGEGWGMKEFHSILLKPDDGTSFYSSWSPFLNSKAEFVAPYRVRFTGDFRKYNFQSGEVLTIRDPIRDHAGAFINRSKNVELKNVSIYYMHGQAILSQFSENLHYDGVLIMPRSESGRMISAWADCMHFSGCKGQITIENCRIKGAHDDAINVHGTHLKITEIVSKTTLKVRFMHPQTYGFEAFFAGDSIAFVHPSKLQVYGLGVVTSAKLISEREMLIELSKAVPAELLNGDCLENITWTPSVSIRNCRFERTNTRGILVTTGRKVVIENNEFFRTGMHAILISDDASSWFESGPVKDVSIKNNIFEECGYNSEQEKNNFIIAIAPENHELVSGYMVHKNIRIDNNTFKVYDCRILTARSTENLIFSNNRIIKTNIMKPYRDNCSSFNLNACRRVKIQDNSMKGFSNVFVQLENMNKKDVLTDIVKVQIVKNISPDNK